jgi:hypothetical protein
LCSCFRRDDSKSSYSASWHDLYDIVGDIDLVSNTHTTEDSVEQFILKALVVDQDEVPLSLLSGNRSRASLRLPTVR